MRIQDKIIAGIRFHAKFSPNVEGLIAIVFRKIRPALSWMGVGVYYDRYSKDLSFYSLREDLKNYRALDGLSFLNIGSGGFVHTKWTNYDYPGQTAFYKRLQGQSSIDFIPIDLRHSLPDCPPGSVGLIYMSHTLEHLSFDVAEKIIKHAHEILAEGGCLRIVVPDVKRLFEYAKLSSLKFDEKDFQQPAELAKLIFTPSSLKDAETIEALFMESSTFEDFASQLVLMAEKDLPPEQDYPPDFHMSFWTSNSLRKIANQAGYARFRVALKNVSDFAPFRNEWTFDTTVPEISLYCDFVK